MRLIPIPLLFFCAPKAKRGDRVCPSTGSLIILFFIILGTVIVVTGLAGLAHGDGLGLQRVQILAVADLIQLDGFGLGGLAELGEVILLLPDRRQGIGLHAGFRAAALGEPVQQIGAAVLDGLGVGNDDIVPIHPGLLQLVGDGFQGAAHVAQLVLARLDLSGLRRGGLDKSVSQTRQKGGRKGNAANTRRKRHSYKISRSERVKNGPHANSSVYGLLVSMEPLPQLSRETPMAFWMVRPTRLTAEPSPGV